MLVAAVVLFAVAALFGAWMAIGHLRGRTPPRPAVAAIHGVFAGAGLIVLFVAAALPGTGGTPTWALGLFMVAALGGFTLAGLHATGRRVPGGLVAGHGLVALVAFVVLVAGALLGA